MKLWYSLLASVVFPALASGCSRPSTKATPEKKVVVSQRESPEKLSTEKFEDEIDAHAKKLFAAGRQVFRYDTFGSEDFWGGKLRLHEAIAGQENGGVGPGLAPKQALELGLKVD